MFAIWKKEIKSYFYSPIAYILTGFFVVATAVLFAFNNLYALSSNINTTLGAATNILVFIVPILTMRLWSEDMKNKSDILLITSPAKIGEIVVGKFLAASTVFMIMVAFTLPFTVIAYIVGEPATPEIIGGYVGFILLGLSFIAIGVFSSSLTESQIIAAVIAFGISIAMMFMQIVSSIFGGFIGTAMNWLSILERYSGFGSGYLELSAVVYYISFIAIFLFFTVMVIEKRRWSKS